MNILHNEDARRTLDGVEYHAVTSAGLCTHTVGHRHQRCALYSPTAFSTESCVAAPCMAYTRNDRTSVIWVRAE